MTVAGSVAESSALLRRLSAKQLGLPLALTFGAWTPGPALWAVYLGMVLEKVISLNGYSSGGSQAIGLGVVSVLSATILLSAGRWQGRLMEARGPILAAAAGVWMIGQGWWVQVALLRVLFGPDYVL